MPTYLITFTTYGTRLHGDERGSVDKLTAIPGTPHLPPHAGRNEVAKSVMNGPSVVLGARERSNVDSSIRQLAGRKNWNLHALNVRTNHLHAVVSSERPPETVMQGMKAWATRGLIAADLRTSDERLWTRHGSTRWLKDDAALQAAIDYVVNRQ